MKRKLTDLQVELLCALLPQPLTAEHAAFQICRTPSAVGRIMGGLCRRGLAYQDLLSTGDGKYSYVVSKDGVEWVRNNRDRVFEVHRDLGFRNEETETIYTTLLG